MSARMLNSRWLVLPLYLLAGLGLGLADRALGQLASGFGYRPGVATALSVNVLLPAVALALAVVRPQLGSVWLGALGMVAGLLLGTAALYAPAPPWDLAAFVAALHPVLILAGVGYGVLGSLVVLLRWSLPRARPAEALR